MAAAPKLQSVQFLRAIAVVSVLISHTSHELKQLLATTAPNFNEKLFPGDFGVDLFFVITGFIMVYTSARSFGAPGASIDFLRRRIIRIIPLYWIMTAVMVGVVVLLPDRFPTASGDWQHWISSFLFVPYMRESDGLIRPILALGWSLQYEMYFYLLFAVSLLFPRRWALTSVIALLTAIYFAAGVFPLPKAIAGFFQHAIVFEFAMGMVLGWVYLKGIRINFGVGCTLVAAAIAVLCLDPEYDQSLDRWRHLYYGVPGLLLLSAAVLTRGDDARQVNPFCFQIGQSSYATYLTHPFVIGGTSIAFRRSELFETLPPNIATALYFLTLIPLMLLVGYLVHNLVDLPITNRLKAIHTSQSLQWPFWKALRNPTPHT